jgi:hypothetical protein
MDGFYARFFSNDSFEKFNDSNTLSSFTTELDNIIKFPENVEYEVGVSEIYINQIPSPKVKQLTNDTVVLDRVTPQVIQIFRNNIQKDLALTLETTTDESKTPKPKALPPKRDSDATPSGTTSKPKALPPPKKPKISVSTTPKVTPPKVDDSVPDEKSILNTAISYTKKVADTEGRIISEKTLTRDKRDAGGDDTKLKTIQELVRFLLKHSMSPHMYTRKYFEKYLDSNILYDLNTLATLFFTDNFTPTDEEKKETDKLIHAEINLNEIMSEDNLLDYLPSHVQKTKLEEFSRSGKENQKVELVANIKLFAEKSFTMLELFHTILKFVIVASRGGNKALCETSNHYNIFRNENERDIDEKNYKRMVHLRKSNEIVHKFINKFTATIETEQYAIEAKIPEKKKIPLHYSKIFLYTNIIEPQYMGSSKSRVLLSFPYRPKMSLESYYERFPHPCYCKVETKEVRQISFALLNENGDIIPFTPSFFATQITLHFRKRNK